MKNLQRGGRREKKKDYGRELEIAEATKSYAQD